MAHSGALLGQGADQAIDKAVPRAACKQRRTRGVRRQCTQSPAEKKPARSEEGIAMSCDPPGWFEWIFTCPAPAPLSGGRPVRWNPR